MKTLILKILLFSIPLLGYGQEGSLFDEIFKGEKVSRTLAQKFVSEGRAIILYHHYFGLSPNEYKNILDSEKAGEKVVIVYVSEEEGVRFDSTQNYNKVIWNYLGEKINQSNRFFAFGFGCKGYQTDWIDNWIGEWTVVFNRFYIYPLIKFSGDSLTLNDYSECIIEEYYIPLFSHQSDGNWKLTIFYEIARVKKPAMKFERAKYLRELFIKKGMRPEQVQLEAAPPPACATLYFPPEDLMGINIELYK